jgi:hypothetical protein
MPYWVGELGPELFVPDSPGGIAPHGAGGGGMSIVNQIAINGSVLGNKDEIARAVGDAMMTRLRRIGVRLPSGA